MGRFKFVSTLALVLLFLSQPFARAQRPDEAIRLARALLSDACKLHRQLESAGADPFTLRSACRLESTTEELLEKLGCPSHIGDAGMLVDDCILWYNRTLVGVRRESCLASDRAIAATLSCAGRQLALLEDSVACLLGHGMHAHTAHGPTRTLPQTPYAPSRGNPAQRLPGHSQLGQPAWGQPGAWVGGPFAAPASSRPGYPFNSRGLAEPFVENPDFGRPEVGHESIRESHYRQAVPSPTPAPRGQIARAVLEMMLSEMSR
jgi:hypothetical protein